MVNISDKSGQDDAFQAMQETKEGVDWVIAYADVGHNHRKQQPEPDDLDETMLLQQKRDEQPNPWKMIPAENLIVEAAQHKTKIGIVVERAEDVRGLAYAMEVGVDALIVRSDAPENVWESVLNVREERRRSIKESTKNNKIKNLEATAVSGTSNTAAATVSEASNTAATAVKEAEENTVFKFNTRGAQTSNRTKVSGVNVINTTIPSTTPSPYKRFNEKDLFSFSSSDKADSANTQSSQATIPATTKLTSETQVAASPSKATPPPTTERTPTQSSPAFTKRTTTTTQASPGANASPATTIRKSLFPSFSARTNPSQATRAARSPPQVSPQFRINDIGRPPPQRQIIDTHPPKPRMSNASPKQTQQQTGREEDNGGMVSASPNVQRQNSQGYSNYDQEQERATVTATSQILPGVCWRNTEGSVVADRVCIDFVRNLKPSEGCWIGSSAKLMALILSEAVETGFIPPRPFRVNAGPVHSYVCLADGTTKYLGEIVAGDEVLVLDAETGKSRAVAVGRCKIEVRPCILVKLAGMNMKDQNSMVSRQDSAMPAPILGQVFLQQVETVRLGQPGGQVLPVTAIEMAGPQDTHKQHSILLRISDIGTHMGRPAPGSVMER